MNIPLIYDDDTEEEEEGIGGRGKKSVRDVRIVPGDRHPSPSENTIDEIEGPGSPPSPPSTVIARRVSSSQRSLSLCGSRLRSGALVSFPTETVYRLGCHALDVNDLGGANFDVSLLTIEEGIFEAADATRTRKSISSEYSYTIPVGTDGIRRGWR